MRKVFILSLLLTGVLLVLSTSVRAQEMKKMKAMTGPAVEQLKLGTAVQDKELVGQDSTFAVNEKVYVWMRITGAADDSITVTWKHADKTYSTTILVGGNSWRTWAYKTVSAPGEWTVAVSTQSGEVLKKATFTVK